MNIQDNTMHKRANASHTYLSDLMNSHSSSEMHESGGIVMSDLISAEEDEASRLHSRQSSNL